MEMLVVDFQGQKPQYSTWPVDVDKRTRLSNQTIVIIKKARDHTIRTYTRMERKLIISTHKRITIYKNLEVGYVYIIQNGLFQPQISQPPLQPQA